VQLGWGWPSPARVANGPEHRGARADIADYLINVGTRLAGQANGLTLELATKFSSFGHDTPFCRSSALLEVSVSTGRTRKEI